MKKDRRRHPRFKTAIPVHFNLNPDQSDAPAIKKLGLAGTMRDVSAEGLRIDSRMALLDMFQIFQEAMKEDSPFELEVFLVDSVERKYPIKGEVRWHRLSEPEKDLLGWRFQAGLYLKDRASRSVVKNIIVSMHGHPKPGGKDDSPGERETRIPALSS